MLRHLLGAAAMAAAVAPVSAAESDAGEQRWSDIEQRLKQLEGSAQANVPAASASAFNPAILLILSGTFANLSQDPQSYAITGFPLPPDAEVGPGSRSFNLGESELGIYANIDPYLYGSFTLALTPEGVANVEEAFIQTISLSSGVVMKAGRFYSGIGYLNSQHSHVWDFVDAPLAYQALVAGQYGNDGVQLTWLAPTETFLEFGVEVGRGSGFPGSERNSNGSGALALFAHAGGDAGDNGSWRAGLSMLNASPRGREGVDGAVTNGFSGDSRLWIADFVYKYAATGGASSGGFKLQGEYLLRDERGDLIYDVGGAESSAPFSAKQSGWYLQGLYQFMPNWRAGLRIEQLQHGTVDYGANSANLTPHAYDPAKRSVMVDYSPSEFSRIRLQVARDESRQGVTDNQIFLQYLTSLGAHGAHQF